VEPLYTTNKLEKLLAVGYQQQQKEMENIWDMAHTKPSEQKIESTWLIENSKRNLKVEGRIFERLVISLFAVVSHLQWKSFKNHIHE